MVALVVFAVIALRVVVWPWLFPSNGVIRASLEELREAPQTGIPYVVKLGAPGCVYCRQMTPIWEELAQLYPNQVLFYDVDLSKHPEVSDLFGVRYIPTSVFFVAGGDKVHTEVGYLDSDAVVQLMKEHGLIDE